MHRFGVIIGCAALSVLVGCSSGRSARREMKIVHKQAAFDLGCPARQIQVTPVGAPEMREYMVTGCGKTARYVERAEGLVLAGPVEGAMVPPSTYAPGVATPPPPPPSGSAPQPLPPPPPPPSAH